MRKAKIEVSSEAARDFFRHLPSDYRIIGTEYSIGREILIFWIEGPDLPACEWVTAVVTQSVVYDMAFREAPVKYAWPAGAERMD